MLLDSMLPVLLKHSTIFTSDNMFTGTILAMKTPITLRDIFDGNFKWLETRKSYGR